MAKSSKPLAGGNPLPELPALPTLGAVKLPPLGALPAIEKPKTLAELEAERKNPLHANEELYNESPEQNLMLDVCVIEDEFAAIREARKGQAEAVALANESEFWFAAYFQSREQCEQFCQALGLSTDKYVDGLELAAACGIEVTPRTVPYKVGKIDRKLADLT
jgi:hypothetical protein